MTPTTLMRGVIASFVLALAIAAGAGPVGAQELPTLVPGTAWIVEGASGSQVVQVPVTLSAPSTTPVTAAWATRFGPGVEPPVPAEPGSDFAAASGTVTFDPGSTAATVAIEVYGDTIGELDEWIVVSFSDATGAVIGGYWGLGFAVVEDDDSPPVIVPGKASIPEGDAGTQTLLVPVTLTEASEATITVRWTVRFAPDVRPPSPATPGEDFGSATGILTFAPGVTEATVALTVYGDEVIEPDEWIVVSLHNPTNATIGGYWGLAFGIIQDDDTPPTIRPNQSPPATVTEGDTGTATMHFPIRLSRPTDETVTVRFTTVRLDSTNPPIGTEGVDYEAGTGTVVFPPGVTEASAAVTIIGDTIDEPDEYVLIMLDEPTNAALPNDALGRYGMGLILDDDGP